MTGLLKVVLDTNIILASINTKSPFRRITDDFMYGKHMLYFTSDILLEYEKKLESNFSTEISSSFIDLLLKQKNSRKKFTHFQLNLIPYDPNDNKFADQLNNLEFPVFNVLKAAEFLKVLENLPDGILLTSPYRYRNGFRLAKKMYRLIFIQKAVMKYKITGLPKVMKEA